MAKLGQKQAQSFSRKLVRARLRGTGGNAPANEPRVVASWPSWPTTRRPCGGRLYVCRRRATDGNGSMTERRVYCIGVAAMPFGVNCMKAESKTENGGDGEALKIQEGVADTQDRARDTRSMRPCPCRLLAFCLLLLFLRRPRGNGPIDHSPRALHRDGLNHQVTHHPLPPLQPTRGPTPMLLPPRAAPHSLHYSPSASEKVT